MVLEQQELEVEVDLFIMHLLPNQGLVELVVVEQELLVDHQVKMQHQEQPTLAVAVAVELVDQVLLVIKMHGS